jgi:predicted HicB family RNase H-like nuclease
MSSDAQRKAVKKYLSSVDEIKIRLKPGRKQPIIEHAALKGKSVNEYITSLIEEDIKKDRP